MSQRGRTTARAHVFVDLWPEQACRTFVEESRCGLPAKLTLCQPGRRLVFTWRELDWPEPASTDVNVLFEPLFGGTLVRVEHSGFERLGPKASQAAAECQVAWTRAVGRVAARGKASNAR